MVASTTHQTVLRESTTPVVRSRLHTRDALHGIVLVVISGLLVGWRRAEHPYADGDILWGARTGLDFLRTGALPHHDPYSWTARGAEWVPNSWGWNVVLGLTYRIGGLAGFALLGIMMSGCIALLAGVLARRAGAGAPMSGLVFQLVGGLFALFLYARAHIVDYAVVLAIPLLLPQLFDPRRARALRGAVAILALQVVWMNLHSAALLGPVLVLAAGAGNVLMRSSGRAAATGRVVALTVAAALCCLATPYGAAPITHAADVRAASVGLITEWLPVGFGSAEQLLAVAALVLGVAAMWFAWRARRFDAMAVLLVLGVGSAAAVRFAPMLALTAVPTLAGACQSLKMRPFLFRRVWVLTSVVLAVVCVVNAASFAEPGSRSYSPALVAQLPGGCRLLNDLDIGGNVILNRSDVPVSIDSRNDVYGRARELESLQNLNDPIAGMAYIARHNVTCVLAPTAAPLVHQLTTNPGWRVAGHDTVRTLLIRRTG